VRSARPLRNRFLAVTVGAEVLGFPLQASLVAPLWQAADETARAQLTPFWAGQAAALTRELPAAELVEKLVAEAQSVLPRSR
jgi:nitronate monooxygenase